MRSTADRVRHAISFEIIGLVLVTPLGGWLFGIAMHDVVAVAVAGTVIATAWNYLYNLLFDHAMLRWRGSVIKTVGIRLVHAVLFEAGLLLVMMPVIAIYLGIGLLEALLIDGALALFYMGYALVFNWIYDRIFPIPAPDRAG